MRENQFTSGIDKEFGRLAGEAIETILEKANTCSELERLMEAFEIFIEATIALRKQEEDPADAVAFEQAARAALAQRIALVA